MTALAIYPVSTIFANALRQGNTSHTSDGYYNKV